MTHATYDSYKESGIPWLGKVPAGWEVVKISYCYKVQLGKMLQPESKTEDDILKPYLRAANLAWTGVNLSDIKEMWFNPTELKKYRLHFGDLLISEGGDVGRASYWEHDQEMYIQNAVNRLRCIDDCHYSKFAFYWFSYLKDCQLIDIVCNSTTIAHYTAEKVKATLITAPSIAEQKTIAEFLDNKTAQIDALIAKKKNLLKLLAEQRTALITNAVTRGLDGSAPMKDSGITWLGKVPAGWEVVKITHGFNLVGSGTTPRSDNLDYYDGDVPWVTTSELRENVIYDTHKKLTAKAITDHASLPLYDEGALLIAMYGATIGRLGILGLPATVNQACCVFDKPKSFDTKFVFWWLQMAKPILISEATGGGQPNLSQDTLKQLRVPCPKIPEQKAIADFLDCKTAEIDATKDRITTAIDTLKEYRTALITNAVTGKIKVV